MRFIRCVTNLAHEGRLLLETHSTPNTWRDLHLPCDFISQPFAGNDGNLLAYSLVGVKVVRESRVVLLDDDPRSFLHGLGTHSTLKDGQ